MATETQVEVSKDPTGLVTRTLTKQTLSGWEDPSDDARSYRVTQTDGVVTIVEEYFDTMPPVYSIDVSTTQEPIESHPKFAELPADIRQKWGKWKQNSTDPTLIVNGVAWNPVTETNTLFQKIYAYFNQGVTAYFAPRIVVKHSTLEDSAPAANDVGIISSTGYPGNTGPVNFILTGLSGQQEGNKWRVTREYLGSARGNNWDAYLYTA
jgi:hypothetical protein